MRIARENAPFSTPRCSTAYDRTDNTFLSSEGTRLGNGGSEDWQAHMARSILGNISLDKDVARFGGGND